jgi:hypothetical protein
MCTYYNSSVQYLNLHHVIPISFTYLIFSINISKFVGIVFLVNYYFIIP